MEDNPLCEQVRVGGRAPTLVERYGLEEQAARGCALILSDTHGTIRVMDDPVLKRVDEKVFEELRKSPTKIRFRVKNNRVDYSIMNRPDPNTTPVTDEWLAPAFVHAGSSFKKRRFLRRSDRDAVQRVDGRAIKYKDEIEIDWSKKELRSTVAAQLTLQVLSIIVGDLMREAYRNAPPPPTSAPN